MSAQNQDIHQLADLVIGVGKRALETLQNRERYGGVPLINSISSECRGQYRNLFNLILSRSHERVSAEILGNKG